MAELNTGDSGGGHKKGKKSHAKKQSTRIDMTPMVDLAFLLLTFFMLTSSFNKPQTMEINMPVPEKENPQKVEDDVTTTFLIGKGNRLFYYDGVFDSVDVSKIKKTDYSKEGVRKLLLDKNERVYNLVNELEQKVKAGELHEDSLRSEIAKVKKKRENKGLIVIIKAEDESTYENVVNIMDEMAIVNVASFALVDMTEMEKKIIENL